MVKRHEPGESLLRFPTIDVADIHSYPTAVADMYVGTLDGMIVRGVLPRDTVELVVDRLERDEFVMNDKKFSDVGQDQDSPYTHSPTLIAAGDDIDGYFSGANTFREKCRALFRDTVDFEQRVEQTISGLSGRLPVRVPSGPVFGSYASASLRVRPTGQGFPIHVGSDFLLAPHYQHLAGLVDGHVQLSYFVTLTVPESGGELIVYALEWEDMAKHYTPEGPSDHNAFMLMMAESFETQSFRPDPGDLLIFNGGRYYHRVAPTVGPRSRCTIGGFVARSKTRDAVYYWS
jgi:hypothetical protein